MPEGIEIELYRRAMADLVGRRVETVDLPDPWWARRAGAPGAVAGSIEGLTITALDRRGKLLLVALGSPGGGETTIGLRFGMTGRPFIDDRPPIFDLEYASTAVRSDWVRLSIGFAGGGRLRVLDPRRLGGLELAPDLERLGPDLLTLTPRQIVEALDGAASLKAMLLDQRRIAGFGNMLADEVLWRAGIDPARRPAGLSSEEWERLLTAVMTVPADLLGRGGSHRGDLSVASRVAGARCPRDGQPLLRRVVAGRGTYSCPLHQV